MAETYRKSKIERLIQKLETIKEVLEGSLLYWKDNPIQPDEIYTHERIAKIELIDELLIDIREDSDLP